MVRIFSLWFGISILHDGHSGFCSKAQVLVHGLLDMLIVVINYTSEFGVLQSAVDTKCL
jgi:hypothetical protein